MKVKIALIFVIMIFAATATVAQDEATDREVRIYGADDSGLDREASTVSTAKNSITAICILDISSSEDTEVSSATLKCGQGEIHCGTDDRCEASDTEAGNESLGFLKAELVNGDSDRRSESVSVVLDSVRCPDGVCYRLSEGSVDVGVVNDPPTTRGNPLYEDEGNVGESPLYEPEALAVIGFGEFSISKRSARTGRNPQTGKEFQDSSPGENSDRAITNRLNSLQKSAQCPVDGREKCITDSVRESEFFQELSSQGDIEILMTLTADPLVASPSDGEVCGQEDSEICRTVVVSIDPDSDDDGLLTVTQTSGNSFEWNVENRTIATTRAVKSISGSSQAIFIQVNGSKGEMTKAELIEAMASHAGLSKADSKKALEGFIQTNVDAASRPSCCFDYNNDLVGIPVDQDLNDSERMIKELDKASPYIADTLSRKDARIEELEQRVRELEGSELNSTRGASTEGQGNDRVVRKKPGVIGSDTDSDSLDADSDGDGLGDVEESDQDDLESGDNSDRPGFFGRFLSSIFR